MSNNTLYDRLGKLVKQLNWNELKLKEDVCYAKYVKTMRSIFTVAYGVYNVSLVVLRY